MQQIIQIGKTNANYMILIKSKNMEGKRCNPKSTISWANSKDWHNWCPCTNNKKDFLKISHQTFLELCGGVTLVRPKDRKSFEDTYLEKLSHWRKSERMFKGYICSLCLVSVRV
jgi:hypothetical protein